MKCKGLKMMLLAFVFLVLVNGSVQATGQLEGCTPGFWKNHLDAWQGYAPDDSFAVVFGVPYEKTLLEALEAGGGGENALGRHAVAALLNAQQLSYRWDTDEVGTKVRYAYRNGAFEEIKDVFEEFNEQYCPLD